MGRVESPHDKLVKEALGSADAMRAMLRSVLNAETLAPMDLSSLTAVAGSFVDEELCYCYCDLLFRVSLLGREAFVYVLVEHKSRSDRWTVFQLLRYCVRVWEKVLKEQPAIARLPPIIPLVIAHDPSGWSAPRSFTEILDPIVTEVPELGRWSPQFEVLVEDLSQATDEQIRRRTADLFGVVALTFLRDCRTPERVVPMVSRMAELLAELWRAPDGRHAVTVLLRYLTAVADVDAVEVTQSLENNLPEAKELLMTIAEQFEQRGLQKGMEQGLQKGRLGALRDTVRKQLALRFGALDDGALARIEEADLRSLERYAERVLTAASVAEVLAPN